MPLASIAQGRPLYEVELVRGKGTRESELDYIWHGVGDMEIDVMVKR